MHLSFFSRPTWLWTLLLAAIVAAGCGEGNKPPTAISLDQIPVQFGKAFASAKGDSKDLSAQVVNAVQAKDFSKALVVLDALTQRSDLSKIQSRAVGGAAITVTAALREAESKGDRRAAETLEIRRRTK